MPKPLEPAVGCRLYPGYFDAAAQAALVAHLRQAVAGAPLFVPRMARTGKPFSVRMSNFGPLGWVSDKAGGYRYQETHPETGRPWPPIPPMLMAAWRDLVFMDVAPDVCLVNYYDAAARMGLHVDRDEADKNVPILSVSLGDRARFRLGGPRRKDPTISFDLSSGDVLVLAPPLRLAYHGIDRVYGGSSRLLAEGGRFNLTMRRAAPL